MLETVAIRELRARRELLEAYQNQARFAFADSYDRAAKAQAGAVRAGAMRALPSNLPAAPVTSSLAACAGNPDKRTLADLHASSPT